MKKKKCVDMVVSHLSTKFGIKSLPAYRENVFTGGQLDEPTPDARAMLWLC